MLALIGEHFLDFVLNELDSFPYLLLPGLPGVVPGPTFPWLDGLAAASFFIPEPDFFMLEPVVGAAMPAPPIFELLVEEPLLAKLPSVPGPTLPWLDCAEAIEVERLSAQTAARMIFIFLSVVDSNSTGFFICRS